ncbi:zinc finger HIT domain-containing protein 1-like protein [Sarcoptes scabiei]|uniref:Zinc finger HIT domain-containing protein 1-like protein n=1 Tax=Sarcoptes scabiei TaxID=52283 RepID=A0A131ZTG4_SARSC|nr:zinc finger HIT domain-containing protein 1-like protein [Sarcoptes scabiei]
MSSNASASNNNSNSKGKLSSIRQRYRILDESTRNRRNRQQIEQLERDNFHEDPHSNLVMHKKIPKFEDLETNSKTGPNNNRRTNYRSRILTLSNLIEENSRMPAPNYLTICTRSLSSTLPSKNLNISLPNIQIPSVKRSFCSVCGFKSVYTCIVCGLRYCSSRCLQTHVDTRCLKWTVK